MQVGHAGTLDPMATGLLVVCTGAGTKFVDDYQAMEKEYSGGREERSWGGERLNILCLLVRDRLFPSMLITCPL